MLVFEVELKMGKMLMFLERLGCLEEIIIIFVMIFVKVDVYKEEIVCFDYIFMLVVYEFW